MPQVEFFAICNLYPVLDHLVQLFVDSLNEVLCSGLQQQYLVIVVSMMAQVAALFTYQFVVDYAKSNVLLQVVRTHLIWRVVIRTLFLRILVFLATFRRIYCVFTFTLS